MAGNIEGPPRIQPRSLAEYLEVMSQTVFWVGISWRVVESKWPNKREAFQGFDPLTVVNLSPNEVDALASDKRVIRHRGKLQTIVRNAGRMLELEERHGSFQDYLSSHAGAEEAISDVRRQFKYLGEMSAHQFLYSVGAINDDGTLRRE